jgi:hypothetical protein
MTEEIKKHIGSMEFVVSTVTLMVVGTFCYRFATQSPGTAKEVIVTAQAFKEVVLMLVGAKAGSSILNKKNN